MGERYFEDFTAGQIFKPSGRVRVEKDEIIAFAKQYDPQAFHLDEEAARKSIFGRLVASGWHTAALTMSLIARSEYRPAGGTIGLGIRGPTLANPGPARRRIANRNRSAGETAVQVASRSRVVKVANANVQPA